MTDQAERTNELDFDRLVDHIRTQSADAPGSDTDRVTIRSLEAVNDDALFELVSTLEGRLREMGTETDPGALTVYLSPTNAEQLLEDVEEDEFGALEDRLGRPVVVDAEMPEDAILVMDPDAVAGGGTEHAEILDPNAIACGTLGAVS